MVEMNEVTSSNVKSIGYDPVTEELFVEFKNGVTYKYFDVESSVYLNFTISESIGKYLNEKIKNSGYRYEKVE